MGTGTFVRSGFSVGCVAAALALAAGCSRESGPAKHATAPTGTFESRVAAEPGGTGATRAETGARDVYGPPPGMGEERGDIATGTQAGTGEAATTGAVPGPAQVFDQPTFMEEEELCDLLENDLDVAQVRDVPAGVALILEAEDAGDMAKARHHAMLIKGAIAPTGRVILRHDAGEGCGIQKLAGHGAVVNIVEREGRIELQITSTDPANTDYLRKATRDFADNID